MAFLMRNNSGKNKYIDVTPYICNCMFGGPFVYRRDRKVQRVLIYIKGYLASNFPSASRGWLSKRPKMKADRRGGKLEI
jgi:hypothetical protein